MSAPPSLERKTWELVLRWLAKADVDMEVARVLLDQDTIPVHPSAFHVQQAAEKMAKAVLIALRVRPPKTHDVSKLAGLIMPHRADIGHAIAELHELTDWYVLERYPDAAGVAPSAAQMGAALSKLRALREHIATLAPGA